ncbi:uncharacterized protein LOC124483259 isoform X1 [Hypomesus transpacificus]|uniref:uncharacterized protein LOC124483259 isoform X1 n=1 Tax=Hypomesus transpacificus TaxID=137520 RepID=UPI001F0723E1|nr:uncharacterized protein LOC124483259 isoform X1 [Hypomesus transpacificus]
MTEAEPLLQVLVGGRPVEMMIDTGAAYSCISAREASHLPRSGELIKTVGFSGLTQLLPMTTPTEIKIDKKTLLLPLVVSEKTPLNLLGRDVLCQLNCILSCTTQHGVMIDRPVPQMMQQLSNEATVFWLGGIRTALESMTSGWTQELESLIPYAHPPTLDYHCTLQYFPTVDCERNDKWLKQQPRTVPIIMRDIFIGPEGAAVAVEETPYEASQHTIKDSLPHVTLLINPGHRARDLGPMVAEASKLKWLPTDRPQVWQTEGEKYFKLRAKAEGLSVPQVVRLPETRPKEMTVEERWTQMLSRVPPELWSAHETDVGLIKSAQPVQVTLKPGCRPPRVRQYPLKKETEAGIEPIIKGLLLAGVLIHSRSPANTPICPVRKADRSKYRLVHDLRALNDVVQELEAVVPNPHTLLTNVPATSKYYTVVDLTSAFFSVPLAEESRDLFAFTYKGQKLTYTRVPQGYIHSPHWFNQALKRDLADIGEQITSTLIMYVDDLALCSNSLEECHRDSMTLLTALAKKGHKASQEKLQYCQPKVQYLSRTLGAGTKGISPCHLLGISQAPKPQSVGDLMTFLGLTGYSAEWVNEYTAVVAPLRAMMKEAGVTSLQAKVKWTEEGERAFTQIKLSLQQAPALALPDYEKPFFLEPDGLKAGYAVVAMTGKEGFATQKAEVCQQPCSAQKAELVALTEACRLAKDKTVNIYTDSSYAHGVCHLFGSIWKARGFRKTDGSPIQHHGQVVSLITAMMLPKRIAIIKCKAHQNDRSAITMGNTKADEAAKQAAQKAGGTAGVLTVVQITPELFDKDMAELQAAASQTEQELWIQRGGVKGPDRVWRNHEGLIMVTYDSLPSVISEAHGVDHCKRGETINRIRKMGLWSPNLKAQVVSVLNKCDICLKNNAKRGVETATGFTPMAGGPFEHICVDFVDMITPVHGKRYMLVLTDRFSRWIEATPAKHQSAETVIKFLTREIIPRFGIPSIISSDNGKAFVDKTVKGFYHRLGIQQRLGCVYHPQSQGIVERANGTLKAKLAKICAATKLNWVDALPIALMKYRSQEHRITKLTPHQILMGRDMPVPEYRHQNESRTKPDGLSSDVHAFVKQVSKIHQAIHQQEETRGAAAAGAGPGRHQSPTW